ncbi:DNA (cytosine-5-)-methyltransferase [Pasteurellaceae bacterium LFhippo2]|nr:DNA (cytosine-5-)-methyltransferase [Pasteurellaceae bacterium LFhippo2]
MKPKISREQKALLLKRAKFLRSNMTDEETILWQELRAKRFVNAKFYRQKIIGHYIVDFVSVTHKLIIELDGVQHIEQQEYDEKRTQYLNELGYRVIRFWNSEINQNLDEVLDMIYYELSPSSF